jgi:hypothetical protein
MLTKNQIIRLLHKYGHFRDCQMTITELLRLSLKDELVVQAIASYQDFHSEALEQLSFKHHLRTHSCDGHVGPATIELLSLPRCGCSDFTAQGSGSWPKNCFGLGPEHFFVIQHFRSRIPSFVDFIKSFSLVIAAYRDIGLNMVFNPSSDLVTSQDDVRQLSATQYHTKMTYTSLRGPIGLAIVPSRPTCSSRIWARFDPKYRPRDILNQWARLYAHELGHNMGLSHTRGGIMNPSITSGVFTKTAWRNDPSYAKLNRYFG